MNKIPNWLMLVVFLGSGGSRRGNDKYIYATKSFSLLSLEYYIISSETLCRVVSIDIVVKIKPMIETTQQRNEIQSRYKSYSDLNYINKL